MQRAPGIRERRVAAAHETTASMAAVAGCARSGRPASTPTRSTSSCSRRSRPTTGCPRRRRSSRRRSATRGPRRWTSRRPARASSTRYATAHAYITSGLAKHVLVIGAELLTRFLDYSDRSTCILFGDGAGAVVLSASDEPGGGLGIELTTEPQGAYMIWLPAGGAKSPPSAETIARGEHYIRMEGKETYRFATRTLASTALEAIRAGRPAARRHRPVHPPPGQHPDHRGGRQGPRPADGADVRQPRPVREHLGGVGADRAGRGRQRGSRQGRRPHRHRRVRGRVHERRGRRSSGPPTRPAASPATPRSSPRTSTSASRSTGTRSTRSAEPSPRSWPSPARSTCRSTTSSPASPAARHVREVHA